MATRGARRCRLAAAAAAVMLAACPGGNAKHDNTGPQVLGPKAPPLPEDFTPPPPLPEPAAPDPAAFGAAYLAEIGPGLQDRWSGFLENCRLRLPPSHALNDARLVTVVALEIEPSGALRGATVATGSGNAEFDDIAVEVVRDAAPFARPPVELLSDDGMVHVTWSFARDRRQAGIATATLERVEWDPSRAVPKLLAEGNVAAAARRLAAAVAAGTDPSSLVALADAVGVQVVLRALGSTDVTTQRAGVYAAGSGRVAAAAPALRKLATDAVDLGLRRGAVLALAEIGDAEAVPVLETIVAGKLGLDGRYVGAAARALDKLGEGERAWAAIEPMLAGTKEQRAVALAALAEFPAPGSTGPVIGILESSGPRDVRVAAARALAPTAGGGDGKAARALTDCLEQRDAILRAACAEALAEAGRAGYRGKAAYWELIKLVKKDRDDRVRAAAVRAAAAIGRDSFARDLYLLRKEQSEVVLEALATGLAWVPGEEAWTWLVKLSLREEVEIRRAVAGALAHRDDAAARELLARWSGDEDLTIRVAAIGALDDLDALRGLLDDDNPEIQAVALRRIAVLSGRPAILGDVARLIGASSDHAHSATVARAWFAARS